MTIVGNAEIGRPPSKVVGEARSQGHIGHPVTILKLESLEAEVIARAGCLAGSLVAIHAGFRGVDGDERTITQGSRTAIVAAVGGVGRIAVASEAGGGTMGKIAQAHEVGIDCGRAFESNDLTRRVGRKFRSINGVKQTGFRG